MYSDNFNWKEEPGKVAIMLSIRWRYNDQTVTLICPRSSSCMICKYIHTCTALVWWIYDSKYASNLIFKNDHFCIRFVHKYYPTLCKTLLTNMMQSFHQNDSRNVHFQTLVWKLNEAQHEMVEYHFQCATLQKIFHFLSYAIYWEVSFPKTNRLSKTLGFTIDHVIVFTVWCQEKW